MKSIPWYGLSEAQRKAYPDIQPLRLTVAPNIAFERAKGAVEEMGWQIVRVTEFDEGLEIPVHG